MTLAVKAADPFAEVGAMFRAQVGWLEIADAIDRLANETGATEAEIGRRAGMTTGTVHNFLRAARHLAPSLQAALAARQLRWKEGRALSALHGPAGCVSETDCYARQMEIARPFLDGWLSSAVVEQVVAVAGRCPDLPLDGVLALALGEPAAAPPPATEPVPERRWRPDYRAIERILIRAAAALELVGEAPEVERLRLRRSTAMLESRLRRVV